MYAPKKLEVDFLVIGEATEKKVNSLDVDPTIKPAESTKPGGEGAKTEDVDATAVGGCGTNSEELPKIGTSKERVDASGGVAGVLCVVADVGRTDVSY